MYLIRRASWMSLFEYKQKRKKNSVSVLCVDKKSIHTTTFSILLRHDSHTLGVDRAKVGIFKQSNQVGLGRLLQGEDGGSLEPEVGLEVLGDLADQALERELADEQVGRLLVPTDLAKRDGSCVCTYCLGLVVWWY